MRNPYYYFVFGNGSQSDRWVTVHGSVCETAQDPKCCLLLSPGKRVRLFREGYYTRYPELISSGCLRRSSTKCVTSRD